MLGKLIKHEFKATTRYYAFLFCAIIGATIINKLFWFMESDNIVFNIVKGVVTTVFVIVLVAAYFFAFAFIIYRFYKNLISDQGYLSFTLPVGTGSQVFSKMIVGVVWLFLTFVMIIISLLILAINTGFYSGMSDAWPLVQEFFKAFPEAGKLAVIILLVVFVGLFSGILMFYTAIAIGHLFTKYRILASVLCYLGLYFVIQIFNTMIMGIAMATGMGGMSFEMLTGSTNTQTVFIPGATGVDLAFPGNVTIADFFNMMSTFMIVVLIVNVCISVAYFVVTRYILNKRLNLD